MHIPKRYGQSKSMTCPFCGKQGITQNPQGIPVCEAHRTTKLPDIKCVCGEWLDVASGKFGPYFRCFNCGNINFSRGMEMAQDTPAPAVEIPPPEEKQPKKKRLQMKAKKAPTETTITSDELDFL